MSAHTDTSRIIVNGPTAKTVKFGADLGVYQHTLHQSALFSDSGLIKLLDVFPREKLAIFTVGADGVSLDATRRGAADGLTGAQLLESVRKGRIWLELPAVNKILPDIQPLADRIFAELHQMHPGLTTFHHDAAVIIASPALTVFYQFDLAMTALLQIRGERMARIWDARAPYISDEHLERQALTRAPTAIDYNPIWGEDAQTLTLKPGMLATWPQFSPHRLVNGDSLNVALAVHFLTPAALLRREAVYANAVLRRKFGLRLPQPGAPGPLDALKAGLAWAARRLNWVPAANPHAIAFHVEPAAPNAVRKIDQAA